MKVKAVLFDLDDTLYPEIMFVRSGFQIVAGYVSAMYGFNRHSLISRMMEILHNEGRGKIFDILLKELGIYSKKTLGTLILLYRTHEPSIKLYSDVIPTIKQLRSLKIRLGIVTDGMASIQRKKINALGLVNIIDSIIYSSELGKEFEKPAKLPFEIALDFLKVKANKALFIGNDIDKDIIGGISSGIISLLIDRNNKDINFHTNKDQIDCHKIKTLSEILPILNNIK